jgi:hypothetical protein
MLFVGMCEVMGDEGDGIRHLFLAKLSPGRMARLEPIERPSERMLIKTVDLSCLRQLHKAPWFRQHFSS